MNKVLTFLCLIVLFLSFTSCTKDNDDNIIENYSSIVGVWEQEGFLETSGYRLVFATDQTGLKIFRNNDGEFVTSSASTCLWEMDGDVVTIYDDVDVIGVYSLNTEGQLVSEYSDELPFDKISDTTLDYY